jgi:dephospho-CoA kinase
MVFAVGLTGNIASGKSTAAQIFSDLGIEVLSADKISKELTALHTSAYKQIIAHFGSSIELSDRTINRRLLRDIIFSDPKQRKWLENLLHPLIRQELESRVNLCSSPYCIVEIPLLIDKKNYPYLNKILLVDVDQNIQIKRVMARDKCTKEQAMSIISSQPDVNVRIKNADDVINNNLDTLALQHSLNSLHLKYLKESQLTNIR